MGTGQRFPPQPMLARSVGGGRLGSLGRTEIGGAKNAAILTEKSRREFSDSRLARLRGQCHYDHYKKLTTGMTKILPSPIRPLRDKATNF